MSFASLIFSLTWRKQVVNNARKNMNKKRTQTERKSRASSDNICKLLAEKYPEQIIEWLFGLKVGKVTILRTELVREPIRADVVILLAFEGIIFHIEFQTTAKSHLPLDLRMLDYYVALKRKFTDKEIRQVLIILNDTGEEVPQLHKGFGWVFTYKVVKLWEQDEDELLKHDKLKSLAVLCGSKANGEKLLSKVAEKINS